jgi:hypothetical protein
VALGGVNAITGYVLSAGAVALVLPLNSASPSSNQMPRLLAALQDITKLTCIRLPVPSRLHTRVLQVTATEAPTAEPTAQTTEGVKDIYIGKGRYVKDDPKKYPAKDDLGPFMGATGANTATHALDASSPDRESLNLPDQPLSYLALTDCLGPAGQFPPVSRQDCQ